MDKTSPSSASLADLPHDELIAYSCELGLSVDPATPRGELLRLVRRRQELLLEVPREALLDVLVWARIPVRRSASKEQLVRHITAINRSRFRGLSEPGLRALARLRGLEVTPGERRETLERRLRHREGFWGLLRRQRRRVVGSLLETLIERSTPQADYQFLPETDSTRSLKNSIEDVGVVGGLGKKLRGAADHYVKEKLDEIEQRIDRKLDEIDERLAEWRDREIRNRLRIVKITLVTAIVVAIVSLGYDYLKARHRPEDGATSPASELRVSDVDE